MHIGGQVTHEQADAELARHHIREVEFRIAEVKISIAELRLLGRPTDMAEDILGAFQQTLDLLNAHLSRLVGPTQPPPES
jgi:hypothetical protein